MKDLRLMIDLGCNMHCGYCCNNLSGVNSRFMHLPIDTIDFSVYRRISISGGEPFMHRKKLYETLSRVPLQKDISIYTNGTLFERNDANKFLGVKNVKSFNIGLHNLKQIEKINWDIFSLFKVRLHIEGIKIGLFLLTYPELSSYEIKSWIRNECDMPNEDWVVLND